MNPSDNDKCEQCGALISSGSTEKLCPACLMSGALESPIGEAETASLTSGGSILRYEYSDLPCEFGSYRLLGLLGRGGMGTVYEAEQITTGRRVALKMLGQQLDSPNLRKRFLREGRLAASVNHPNSLYVFGSEEIEGLPVITMEIAGSGTLKDILKKKGPLEVTEAVDAILDVISGLESAFVGGVLHRDIKPSNCFVNPDGSVKVGDFGLSVSTLDRTDTFVTAHGKIMGTPAYSSPEQLRGDALDVRADIYSVGATLFTLLTNEAPFDGENVIQVVANAVNQKPKPLTELRKDIPTELARVITRCLAKEPEGRYPDYAALRNALLPFSSKEPEPASMKIRVSTGWVDYLIAFFIPYVTLMILVGPEKLLIEPLVERTLYSARYHLILLGFGFLYFSIVEGIWGAGLGKCLKGLRVVRKDDRPPGIARALLRILVPIGCIEAFRVPIMMATASGTGWTGFQTAMLIVTANVSAWIPILLTLVARRENGFATVWDIVSGTRVIIKPKGIVRPSITPVTKSEMPDKGAVSMGPYHVNKELVPGQWIVATDPVLRRQVWLLRRTSLELGLARKELARHSRLRWLQKVETSEAIWDAFEATEGVPFSSLLQDGKRLPWSNLRHWLHDISMELWDSTGDKTLPGELSLDHIWIATQGYAILLDKPWPNVETKAEYISIEDFAGQQRFLNAIAECVDSTFLPLHVRGVLANLNDGKFEKLSFLTGILYGLLDKPADVSKGVRAGAIFMMPVYVSIMVFVATYPREGSHVWWQSLGWAAITSAMLVLGVIALIQLIELPFKTIASHDIFRLAVINAKGQRASRSLLYIRWAIVWLPLFVPVLLAVLLYYRGEQTIAFILAVTLFVLWISAAICAVLRPNRGLHDRLAGTWVVRS